LRRRHIGEQAIEFFLDDLIAFAGLFFQSGPVKHRDVATVVMNRPGVLTSPGDLCDSPPDDSIHSSAPALAFDKHGLRTAPWRDGAWLPPS
jgi:hypothetical protein